ncbi:hypothetical protein C9F11_27545 [Streptomyces sp. YIM 121038]|uniref:hypothetical protein n=1 Tax=Streptomyces sp. YIM 121038 TaxID=2136401 RepID=UPI0011105235|nr:hypothetical protein [Streptomyces sp. YIM 121038]QCX79111.1 hypothetical protein C9F11_27545 [Streptomyces sp. YIM 121038]
MSPQPSNPTGLPLVLVLTGMVIALTSSLAALVTGNRSLMGVAAVGFALQLAGWALSGRRNGGAR